MLIKILKKTDKVTSFFIEKEVKSTYRNFENQFVNSPKLVVNWKFSLEFSSSEHKFSVSDKSRVIDKSWKKIDAARVNGEFFLCKIID